MKRILTVFSVIILGFMLIACADMSSVQETQSDGQISVSILDVREGQETLFGELPEGEVWLLIDVAVQNIGQVRRSINTLLMFRLEDETSRYDVDIFAEGAGALDGDLNVGERKEATLTFAVSKDSDEFRLLFTPNVNQPGEFEFIIVWND